METSGYTTAGGVGVEVEVRDVPETALEEIVDAVGERRGGVLSSGMEYPGRYSRWHLAYVDPCLEIVARGRRIGARALNERGRVLLPVVTTCLLNAGKPTGEPTADHVEVFIPESEDILPEEMRSRRPTVFTAIREGMAAFAGAAAPRPGPPPGRCGAVGPRPRFPVGAGTARPRAARRPARPRAAPARPDPGDRP